MTESITTRPLATPKGLRLHLGIFGRRNAGKSSLLNALTRQHTSIVSDSAGTTTDPVEKPMELLPIGPVLFIDTAGIDDEGSLGQLRIEKTVQIFDRTEIGLLVVDLTLDKPWDSVEDHIIRELSKRNIPVLVVLNKGDLAVPPEELLERFTKLQIPWVVTSGLNRNPESTGADNRSLSRVKEALVRIVPEDFLADPHVVSDLIPTNELVVLVVPIDKEAPKGRLILPQVQTIRDLLDGHQMTLVVQETQLAAALARCATPPALVVTDSQVFKSVDEIVPNEIPLTSFSILFARQKGDLLAMARGARSLATLKKNARILIAESCSHHPIADDIGTCKIPNWLRRELGSEIEIGHVHGHDFPDDDELASWDLVIHCGACMTNRKEILTKLARCQALGIPMTNYGLAIAWLHGILDRAMQIFERSQT
ncbi:MAG: [FeFe] hydrogenase H-cluster maturation GTPase HydF [Planctomycetia bacterium]|nr:[FeFe] hydrogenase H-cluster maturation GTPase HydF [Planctomycetia bacterium]